MDEFGASAPFGPFLEPSRISVVPSGKALADQVVLNPFDLPFGTDSEAMDLGMYEQNRDSCELRDREERDSDEDGSAPRTKKRALNYPKKALTFGSSDEPL